MDEVPLVVRSWGSRPVKTPSSKSIRTTSPVQVIFKALPSPIRVRGSRLNANPQAWFKSCLSSNDKKSPGKIPRVLPVDPHHPAAWFKNRLTSLNSPTLGTSLDRGGMLSLKSIDTICGASHRLAIGSYLYFPHHLARSALHTGLFYSSRALPLEAGNQFGDIRYKVIHGDCGSSPRAKLIILLPLPPQHLATSRQILRRLPLRSPQNAFHIP